ncbi:MAG: hypothetical protein Q9O62_05890 [Ardenticatenia bacterium]|nr:hypothetical protein [Ardenticatenia bacterium]
MRPLVRCTWWILLPAVLLAALMPAGPAKAEEAGQAVSVWALGAAGSTVLERLRQMPGVVLVDRPALAEVVLLHDPGVVPAEAWPASAGLLVIPGPRTAAEAWRVLVPGLDVRVSRVPVSLQPLAGPVPLLRQINWHSAPQVRERTVPVGPGWDVLVQTFPGGEPVLARSTTRPQVFWLSPWQGAGFNVDFIEWPYYDYLLYALVAQAAGQSPLPFAEWPLSPVPHAREQRAVMVLAMMMLGTTFSLFLLVRRHSRRHPEMLRALVVEPAHYQTREATTSWEDVGFHRPLAGFMTILALGLFLFIPFMLYQTVIVPRYLVPSAQVLGAWGLVFSFFNTFWILFDMGTSVALVKYFSQHRVDNPVEGIQFVQLFVWWQALTGTVQIVMVTILAAFVVPQTRYAFLAYYILLHALIQFPGFLRVFQYLFRALQRLDYDQLINILAQPAPGGTGPGSVGLVLIAVQSATLVAVRALLGEHPLLGRLSGAVGLGVGLYMTELAIFAIGFWLYRRLGYGWRVVFMAHFDSRVVWRALSFGAMITLAGVIGAGGWSAQVMLMERRLFNYTELQGNWNVAFGLVAAFSAVAALYQGVMPAFSEAYSHGYRHLSAYYVAQGFKYGGWFCAFVAGSLLAVADRFILGSLGEAWGRAAQMVGVLLVWGAFQFPAWFSDSVQQGAGKPWLVTSMLLFEQVVRIGLMALLIGPFQIGGVIAAYLVALPLKDVVAWVVNARLILRPALGRWQTFVAPMMAGSATYLTLRSLGGLVWRGDLATSLLLFFVATLPALAYYSFWCALAGGWDKRGLVELRRAMAIAPASSLLRWLVWWPTLWGARLSPLHGRFPVPGYREARREARVLTRRRVALPGAGSTA